MERGADHWPPRRSDVHSGTLLNVNAPNIVKGAKHVSHVNTPLVCAPAPNLAETDCISHTSV